MEAFVFGPEVGPVRRSAAWAVGPLVRFTERLFGAGVPGFNFAMFLFAAVWAVLMPLRPETFDTGRFAGMHWLPDAAWIVFFAVLALLHALAFFRPDRPNITITADLLTAWIWLSVAASFLRIEVKTGTLTPGTCIYIIMGFSALFHGIYCVGRPRNGG